MKPILQTVHGKTPKTVDEIYRLTREIQVHDLIMTSIIDNVKADGRDQLTIDEKRRFDETMAAMKLCGAERVQLTEQLNFEKTRPAVPDANVIAAEAAQALGDKTKVLADYKETPPVTQGTQNNVRKNPFVY